VENKGLYVEAIQRSNVKFSALQLERVPVTPAVVPSLGVDKGRLLMKMRSWGREFLPRVSAQQRAEQVRQHLARFNALRPQPVEVVSEKLTSAPQEIPRQAPGERLTPSVEEMAQRFRQRRDEAIAKRQKAAHQPSVKPKQSPHYAPSVQPPRQGRGISM
jgi:hypothetical protein